MKNSIFKKNYQFKLFWIGQTISIFGSQFTLIGLPLTAIYILGANSTQMGIFQFAATLPFFLFSLLAGVWIDRYKKKPLLILCNLISAICLLVIPLGAIFDFLSLNLFYVIVFITGVSSMIFELAYLSFFPMLVSKNDLTEGNSKLEISRSTAEISGPSLAGYIISFITAPIAILFTIFGYIVSTIFLLKVKITEPKTEKINAKNSVLKDIAEGLKLLFKHPILRSLSLSTAVLNFVRTAFDTIFLLYIIRTVGLSTSQLGLAIGLGSIGGILGAFTSNKIANKIGIGKSIILSVSMLVIGSITISVAGNHIIIAMLAVIIGQMFIGFGNTMYFVTQVSLRQFITPLNILGRINASNRFISRGVMPIGAILGGIMGSLIDLRTAIFVISLGYLVSLIWLIISPVKNINDLNDLNDLKNINDLNDIK